MKKLAFTALLAVLMLALTATAGQLSLPQTWDFQLDPQNTGEQEFRMTPDFKGTWQTIKTGHWEGQGIIYDGYVWYRTSFLLPATAAPGGTVTAHFGAVDEDAKIWLNGQLLGTWKMGWNVPFDVDLTPAVSYGKRNTLVIKVLDQENCGGIWRPVTIKYQDRAQEPAIVQRLRQEGIRGITAGMGNDTRVHKLKQAGLNTALIYSYILRGATPGPAEAAIEQGRLPNLKRIEAEAKLSAKHDMVTMPVIWVHDDTIPFLKKAGYRTCVDSTGRTCNVTPCPADETFWQQFLKPLFCQFAHIQKKHQANGGAIVDFEFYTGDFSGGFCYDQRALKGCFCDDCFYSFLKANDDLTDNIPRNRRSAYIHDHFSIDSYLKHLERRIYAQARLAAQAPRAIKSDFLLGCLHAGQTWYAHGIQRGFSSPTAPVVLLSEKEYFTGWNSHTQDNLSNFNQTGYPYLYAGGLTISSFNAEGLAAKATELACKAHGYWLYYGETLMNDKTKIVPRDAGVNEYVLREPPKRYWPALRQANTWLNQHRQTWKPAQTSTRGQSVFTTALFPNRQTTPRLQDGKIMITPLPEPTLQAQNLNFSQPFSHGWKSIYQPPAVRNGSMTFDFRNTQDMPWASVWQIIGLQPNTQYQIAVETRCTELQEGHLALQAYHTHTAGAFAQQFNHHPQDKVWEKLSIRFKTPKNKLHLTLQAHGKTGTVTFRNLTVTPMQTLTMQSAELTPSQSLKATLPEDTFHAQLLNPQTQLAFFNLHNGFNDLTWLHTLFPQHKTIISLTITTPFSTQVIELPELILYN